MAADAYILVIVDLPGTQNFSKKRPVISGAVVHAPSLGGAFER